MSKKIDLSLFRGDDSGDEMDLLSVKPIELDPLKSRTFAHGVTKKTKKDLEKEEEERKRAEEDEFVLVPFEEFTRTFDEPGTGPSVRNYRGGRSGGRSTFVRAGGAPGPATAVPTIVTDRERERTVDKFRVPSPPRAPKPRGKRAMDAFLEEIKSRGDITYDRGGPVSQETTNLCVTNLPTGIREHQLGQLFAQMGPVATVKIMWPRAGTEPHPTDRFRPGLTGFVAFMVRKDAAGALARFDGYSLNGNRLRVTWGKPVQLPRRSAYESPNVRDGPSDRSSRGRSVSPLRAQRDARGSDSKSTYWLDQVPAEELQFLQDVSKRVQEHGPGLLDRLKDRERANPKFAFLFENSTAAHYIFQHFVNSKFTFPDPPPKSFKEEGYASAYSSDSDEREEMTSSSKIVLGKLAHRRLEAMLRSMSGKRVEVARAMEFALKRADAYDEVTQIICLSLCVEDTPIPRKIARLHLVSDILHNSSSSLPNVWRYRQSFENRLPAVFEHFARIHNRLLEYSGTLSANVFIQQVDAVLDIWERWMVLSSEIQSQLRQLLHGECTLASLAEPQAPVEPEPEATPVVKSAGFKSSFKRVDLSIEAAGPVPVPTVAANLDGEPFDDLDGEPLEDLDEEPLEDLDGEPVDGIDGEEATAGDGEPVDHVDGAVEAVNDVDGELIDDLDGEDMDMDMDDE
ncbi:hypothetical protein CspeluHIS016_0703530 [Cutaneotrichosporon spelunceum]|uniref:RRM domain-containing protein n=1 Tax=Cutaneotrichosporon spelunceum TaxID=1672016 RepID=A0AAD3TYN7_9TREE|nr:hypothetical protein CspeluHIS016_0703530 [Cutaneotrichosporon spelunceum]